jgi:hypothetical protein
MACRHLWLSALLLPAALAAQQPMAPPAHFRKLAHTYSIVAFDSVTGDLGVAVQSKFPNVGGIVPWGRAGVGAVATQSLGNTAYGERGLDLVAQGATAEQALREVMKSDTMLQDRQVGIVDAKGNAASFSGTRTFDWSGGRVGGVAGGREGGKGAVIAGRGYAVQANMMVSDRTVKNMAATFEATKGDLSTRLTPALVARLEPILLAEPVNQPQKWLTRPQGTANQAFLEALRDFMYWENYDVRVRMDGRIDRVVLQDILAKRPGR